MPYLSSLKDDDGSIAVFARFPVLYTPFVKFSENVFWGESSLPEKERQVVYAYVSKLNGCDYCFGGHNALARSYGAPEGAIEALLDDIETAPVDDGLKALARYARKLTLSPSDVTADDAQTVKDAGWDEDALHMVVVVCSMANFMNRLADGVGLIAQPGNFDARVRNAREIGYSVLFDRKVAEYGDASSSGVSG